VLDRCLLMGDPLDHEMDCVTCLIMQKILSDEIEDEELLDFAIENLSEMMGYSTKETLIKRIVQNSNLH